MRRVVDLLRAHPLCIGTLSYFPFAFSPISTSAPVVKIATPARPEVAIIATISMVYSHQRQRYTSVCWSPRRSPSDQRAEQVHQHLLVSHPHHLRSTNGEGYKEIYHEYHRFPPHLSGGRSIATFG